MSFTYNKAIQEMKIAGYQVKLWPATWIDARELILLLLYEFQFAGYIIHSAAITKICHVIWKAANKITLTSKINASFYFGNGKHEWTLTFTLGSDSVPSSIYASQFSLDFECVPKVTRVSHCFTVRVVITDFKTMM